MAKEKEKPVQQELSESTKKVYAALTENGYKIDSTVAIMVKEKTNEYKVSQNYMSTGIAFTTKELDLSDLEQDGVKIWRTWSFCDV